jgi:ribonucleotide monophosphatase NagD (HAD superfamily)
MEYSKTIFCDIDGTLVKHYAPHYTASPDHEAELLPHTIDKLEEWNSLGYSLILVTGRKESQRNVTIKQLAKAGIVYDQLIMGVGRMRILINDKKPDGQLAAKAINIKRNVGISNVKI